MKTWTYIFCVILFAGLFETIEVNAVVPPKKNRKSNVKTSCAISRAKYASSDLIVYNFGVVAGQNISTIKSQNDAIMDIVPGIMGGVAAQIIWPKGFTLQPEILYSQKGCVFSGSGLTYKIDYVEVPVKVMYRLNIAYIKPFAFAAPYGAYAINFSEVGDISGDDTFSNLIKKWDFGVGAGAGFDVWKLQVAFRYSWGFAQVVQETFNIRNKVFTASAGLFF